MLLISRKKARLSLFKCKLSNEIKFALLAFIQLSHTKATRHFVNQKQVQILCNNTTMCNAQHNSPSYLREGVANQMAKHAWKLKIMYKMHSARNQQWQPTTKDDCVCACVCVCVSEWATVVQHMPFVCVPRLGFVNAMKCDSSVVVNVCVCRQNRHVYVCMCVYVSHLWQQLKHFIL